MDVAAVMFYIFECQYEAMRRASLTMAISVCWHMCDDWGVEPRGPMSFSETYNDQNVWNWLDLLLGSNWDEQQGPKTHQEVLTEVTARVVFQTSVGLASLPQLMPPGGHYKDCSFSASRFRPRSYVHLLYRL